jgi:hypothetical protein
MTAGRMEESQTSGKAAGSPQPRIPQRMAILACSTSEVYCGVSDNA